MAIIQPFTSRCTIVSSNDESRFVYVFTQLDDQNRPLYVVEDERDHVLFETRNSNDAIREATNLVD